MPAGRTGIAGQHVQAVVDQGRDVHAAHRLQRNPFASEGVDLPRNRTHDAGTVSAVTHWGRVPGIVLGRPEFSVAAVSNTACAADLLRITCVVPADISRDRAPRQGHRSEAHSE